MPKGSQFYSADMVQLVAQANRRIAQEAKRQAAGGPEATEEGRIALKFAMKELEYIYGHNAGVEKLSLKGLTDPQEVRQVMEAAERITGSKLLTAAGRKEVEQQRIATFFDVDRGKITAAHRKIWKALTSPGGLFDKLHEMTGIESPSKTVQKAIDKMEKNGFTKQQIIDTLKDWADEQIRAAEDEKQNIFDYVSEKYPDFNWKAN